MITYSVKRMRRKTVTLRVDPSGAVTVYAPYFVWGSFISRFVQKNAAWIQKRLAYFKERASLPRRVFSAGHSFPVWGEEILLEQILPEETLSQGPDAARTALETWYVDQTAKRLPETVARHAPRLGVTPRRVRVANQRSRWGSCSPQGNLRFSWRLATLPDWVLDYVVVHELAHLKQADHSPRFWAIVESLIPDYKTRRTWLRKNTHRYAIDSL